MKLLNVTIYGFGKWIDYTIDFSSEAASCIYGENESGKSTLQRFILFMLFGLPPKQRDFYRPKTSGKMGGRLSIYDPDIGTYTIERFDEVKNGAAICYTADGKEFDENWLKDRLKGMTYKTYQSIFSFSAIDLNALKDMKEDDLGEVLLGIGLTGSTTIYSIEKRLDNKIGELFKPYGKKPHINSQLDLLNELYTKLHHFKSAEASYRDKKMKASFLSDEIGRLQTGLKQEKLNLTTIEKQQHAMPVIHEYLSITKQLTDYPTEITFPENGLERLERIKEKLLPIQSELSVLKDNHQKYHEKIAEMQEKIEDSSTYDEAQQILKNKENYMDHRKELEKIKISQNKMDVQINNEINQLNIGIQQEDLASLSFPFHLEKTWNHIKNSSDKIAFEKEQLQQEHNQLKNQRNYLMNQIQELEDGLLSEKRINKLNDKISIHKENDVLNKLTMDAAHKKATWEKSKATKIRNTNYMLIGSFVLSLVLGTIAFFSEFSSLFSVMVLVIIIGIIQSLWRRRSVSEMEKLFDHESLRSPAIHITEKEKEEAEHLLSIHYKHSTEIASVEEQLKAIELQLIKWNEKRRIVEEKEARLHTQIEEQQKNYPFLQYVEIVFWPELYHSLKNILKLVREQQELNQSIKQLNDNRTKFQNEVNRFLQANNWESRDKSIDRQLEDLEGMVKSYQHVQKQIEQYEHLRIENRQQQRAMKQKMQPYEKELTALYTSAKTDTEDAYYEKAKLVGEKRDLEEARFKMIEQLYTIFSNDTWKQFVEEDKLDEGILQISQQQSNASIKQMENTLEEKRQQLADVNAELSQMESSESHSKTIHQFEMEQEQLNKLAKEWAVLKTAKETLVETKRNYRDKYLTKVLEKTSSYFRELTGNGYKEVYGPVNGKPFQVESCDNIRYKANELSQGTIDQLYISLRLAISEIMSENHRLPFIIDDAFVHFDSIRTKRMMNIVSNIAKKQQVIIFTCKKDVVESSKNGKIIKLQDSVRIN